MRPVVSLALIAALSLVSACSEQAWTFRNGAGVAAEPPPILIAEIYQGECGFACQPPGPRVYCEALGRTGAGPAPHGLMSGESYCFLGVGADVSGDAYAIGCTPAVAGGSAPIEVVLDRLTAGATRPASCGPSIELDAGDTDAGPPFDAGPFDAGSDLDAGRDAGGDAGPDAGRDAGRDAGPLDAGPIRNDFSFRIVDGTDVLLTRLDPPGNTLRINAGSTITLNREAYVGQRWRVAADAEVGFTFDRFQGVACEGGDPLACDFTIGTEPIFLYVYFIPD